MEGRYDRVEFSAINYMSNSSNYQLGCLDSNARMTYYGISGIPDCYFGGTENVGGGGAAATSGDAYDPLVLGILDDPTTLTLEITSYDFGLTPHVDVQLDVTEDMGEVVNTYLRVFIMENDMPHGIVYQNVLRDWIADEAVTVSAEGESQSFSIPIDMGAFHYEDRANLWLLAMVQRDSDKYIIQGTTSYPTPEYAYRYYTEGDRVVIGSGAHEYGDFVLFNSGNETDTFYLTLDTSELPGTWDAYLLDEGSTIYYAATVILAPGESVKFNMVISTGLPGGGIVGLNINSENGCSVPRTLGYTVITADTEVLLVDDDGAFDYESLYFGPALATTGRSFAIWDRNSTPPTAAVLSNFDAVVWGTGFAFPTLNTGDRAALKSYLDAGGSLFVTGQDIGWEMNDIGGAAAQWYHNYLHATFVSDDTNNYTLEGVPGDPISHGLSLVTSGGDGANNQQYPSDIDPYDASASVIFTYDASRNGAIKADTGTYRVVYMAFGFEAINNAADRAVTMQKIINWLFYDVTGMEDEGTPFAIHLGQNVPNPFNPKTEIRFSLGEAGAVSLEVFDVNGRLVTVLENGVLDAGEHQTVWDGLDSQGHAAPSGLYFYRLVKGAEVEARKMLLVK